VRGYKEEGTTTTPFDMVMMNDTDRYHLVMDVIDRVPGLGPRAASVRQLMTDTRRRARQWTRAHGDDLPEVRDWQWDAEADPERGGSPSTTADPDTGADNL
jgi:xylulose-5-phosphate/fructose-6-phosphate phosphoketolase